jgi:hypothetical protein
MRYVWKYAVQPGRFTETLPGGAKFLTVHADGDKAEMWFEVDTDAPARMRAFATVPTGFQPVPDRAEYLGTFFVPPGLVFHLYEESS